ncbi:MAG TPA: hypothetical protein VHW45_20605 [Candidatus Sulfotelmatobacter sp.]|jgi:hypothetical protein|nr:hypothetical protein [Candidatus Sulfotelmatobacter sp.]
MTAEYAKQLDLTPPPVLRTIAQRSLIVGIVFGIGAVILAVTRPDEFYRGYLLGFLSWLGVSLGSMAIIMIRHLTGGGWGVVIRRIQGAAMRTLPLLTVLFIPIIVAVAQHRIYPWVMPSTSIQDEHIREHLAKNPFITDSYLNFKGFLIRAIIYFAIWNLISFLLSKWSKQGDHPHAPDNTQKFKAVAGPGLILYAFTISFATIDWVMSLDPSWISTMFGLIILIGQVLSAMCFAVIVERILVNYKPMSDMLTPDFVHDHGKWMLTFIMVWAYFSFSQWLIIWAGNLPSEITFYLKRLSNGWGEVGLFLALFHFVVPFAVLLSRPFKRNIRKLVWVAIWLIFMRYVDLFWIIEPNFSKSFTLTIADIVVPIAIGGFWLAFFFRNLVSLPLLPVYDPTAIEVLQPEPHHGGT